MTDRIADAWDERTPYAAGDLASAFREVAGAHSDEADVFHLGRQQAQQCAKRAERLRPFAERYAEDAPAWPRRPCRSPGCGPG